jgi:hypothetical protein
MRVVPPGTRAQHVAREVRARVYPARKGVNRFVMKNGRIVKDEKGIPVGRDDPGGRGGEIVCEALACPACAASRPRVRPGRAVERGDHLDRPDDARVEAGQVVGRDPVLLVQPAAADGPDLVPRQVVGADAEARHVAGVP